MTAGKKISIDLGGDDMRICPNCNKEFSDNIKFCTHCGCELNEEIHDTYKGEEKKPFKWSWVLIIGICVFLIVVVFCYFGMGMGGTEDDVVEDGYLTDELSDDDKDFAWLNEDSDALECKPTAAADEAALNEFIFPHSDFENLKRLDIEGLSKGELKIARNEIYARHGRMFQDDSLQAYFNSCSWYTPSIAPEDFKESILNEVEIANRDLIVSYEKEMGYR